MKKSNIKETMKHSIVLGLAAVAFLAAGSARAKKVYLNGVDLDAVYLVNMNFKGCIVRLDAKGNVHITAPNYEIKPTGTPARAASRQTRVGVATDYYIVSFTNRPGATQYDVEIFINGKFVRRIRSSDKQVWMKVSHLLRRGRNEILFVSRKNYGGKGRISTSPVDYIRVVLGRGFLTHGRLVIKTADAETKRTAAETKSVIYQKQVIVAR